jgi:type IV secretion system protein VirB4
MHGTGCHAAGTKILMYDGSVKNVEEIDVGEQIMGDDSTPRTVQKLASGISKMYKIVPAKGDPWLCNDLHVLSLKCNNKQDKNYGKIYDITV